MIPDPQRSPAWQPALGLVVSLACAALLGCRAPEPSKAPPEILAADTELELVPGEMASFRLPLEAGEFVRLEIEQDGIDVAARWYDPRGELEFLADRSIYENGPELILAVAETPGEFRLELEAFERPGPPGRVRLRLDGPRRTTSREARRALLYQRFLDARQRERRGDAEATIGDYREIAELCERLGEHELWLEATIRAGEAWNGLRRYAEAAAAFERAASGTPGDERFWRMIVLGHLGGVEIRRVDASAAIAPLTEALELAEALGDRFRQARAHYHLGKARRHQGAVQRALEHFEKARELYEPWELAERGYTLTDLGVLHHWNLGRPERALEIFAEAREARDGYGDAYGLSITLNQMGAAHETLGEADLARGAYEEALDLRREIGRACAEANTQVRLALLDQAAGETASAEARAARAREILAQKHCRRDRTAVEWRLGAFEERAGREAEARDAYRRALERFEALGDLGGQAVALLRLANVCRRLVDCEDDPLELTERALEIFEYTRGALVREEHRLAYGSTSQELFDLRIELLWERGETAAAFETVERARARALRDRLRQVDAEIARGLAPHELEAIRRLRWEIGGLEERRHRLASLGRLESEARAALERELGALDAELAALEIEIASRDPRYFELMRAEPLSPEALRELLDPRSAILEYRLGERRSFLWLLTTEGFLEFELAPRAAIEAQTREARALLSSPEPIFGSEAWRPEPFEALAAEILPPAALRRLEGKRLLIVADGVLETIPFAALPAPSGRPLVENHEILHLPSASVWAELRRRPREKAPKGWLAVVADPVYGPDDERLPPSGARASSAGAFSRLKGTRSEAEAILETAPRGAETRMLLGFEATRGAVLGGDLRGYRFVHFATHGEVHPLQPARSFLAFSELDPEGREIRGRLFAHELYGLDLPAELVVLSGCDTGLGPSIPGEGLVSGLTRGFLYAGARRVMASLWPISDTATPELMTRFYARLAAGEDPAAALGRVQSELYREGRHPREWAGFVIQGD